MLAGGAFSHKLAIGVDGRGAGQGDAGAGRHRDHGHGGYAEELAVSSARRTVGEPHAADQGDGRCRSTRIQELRQADGRIVIGQREWRERSPVEDGKIDRRAGTTQQARREGAGRRPGALQREVRERRRGEEHATVVTRPNRVGRGWIRRARGCVGHPDGKLPLGHRQVTRRIARNAHVPVRPEDVGRARGRRTRRSAERHRLRCRHGATDGVRVHCDSTRRIPPVLVRHQHVQKVQACTGLKRPDRGGRIGVLNGPVRRAPRVMQRVSMGIARSRRHEHLLAGRRWVAVRPSAPDASSAAA